MAPAPTHSVTHRHGWQANIYIAASLLTQLRSRNTDERNNARTSVCIRFRKACTAKFPEFGLTRIEYDDLVINSLATSVPVLTKPPAAKPVVTETHCCDDDNCVPCDIGYHSAQCRKGCTIP